MMSAPGPQWHLRPRHDVYARMPWLFGPIFLVESPFRLRHEVLSALPDRKTRHRYLRDQLKTLVTAPISVSRMAARARLIASYDRMSDCEAVSTPTLVIQGDPALDHVTGSGGTEDYVRLVRGARLVTVERTGHLGSITRAADCADIINRFLDHSKDTHHSAA
jgi:pimeloyl-ACP methyl ester carboxylesterase